MYIKIIPLMIVITFSSFTVCKSQNLHENLYRFLVSETKVKTMFQDFQNPVFEDSTKMEIVFFSQKNKYPTIYSEDVNIYFLRLDDMFFPGILYFLIIDKINESKNEIFVTLYFTNDLDIATDKIPQYVIHLTIKKKKNGYKLKKAGDRKTKQTVKSKKVYRLIKMSQPGKC